MLLFANNQQLVVPAIWKAIEEIGGEKLMQKVLHSVSRSLAKYYREKITASDPKKRLEQFTAILEEEGGLVDLVAKDGQITITKRTCAFISMFDDQRHVCAIDLDLMSAIAGCPVRLTACRHDGAPCCQFESTRGPARGHPRRKPAVGSSHDRCNLLRRPAILRSDGGISVAFRSAKVAVSQTRKCNIPAVIDLAGLTWHNSPMTRPGKNIAVLGSTGSIGRNALEVIANSGGELCAKALSAHNNVDLLCEQAVRFRPRWIMLTDPEKAGQIDRSDLPQGVELLVGPEGIARAVGDAGDRHGAFGNRRKCRPARNLGRLGGRQIGGLGQQGKPRHGGSAGHAAGRGEAGPDPAGRQRTQRRLPGHAVRPAERGGAGDSYRQRGAVSYPHDRATWPKSRSPRPWPTPLGTWGRKLPSIRPPS